MKTFLTILITALLAVGGTWLLKPTTAAPATVEHKPLFYQSPMHPWIKSDKPGRCTICGMELVPIYPGDKGFEATDSGNTVSLTQSQIQILGVETSEAKIQPLVRTLEVAGMIDDDERRHRIISAYVDGRVDKLFANHHGAEVTSGAPLAELYSPELLQAEREYRQLSGDLKRNTALRLLQMGLTNDQIAALPDKAADSLDTEILAPMSGTVVEHHVYEGQYVKAGENLFEIADFSVMWFQFDAYEQDLPWIEIGQQVTVTTPSRPGKSFEGKITFIDPNLDEATRSAKIRVELQNPMVDGRRELLHKLYANGTVKITTPAALSIPRSAIIRTGSDAVAYIDQGGGSYAQTLLTIGRQGDSLAEILSGLKAGDKVVTNGNLLIDGQAELSRSFVPSPMGSAHLALTTSQQAAIRDFIRLADAMAAALGEDDLPGFNKASEPAKITISALTDALASLPNTKEEFESLAKVGDFHSSENLPAARAAFLNFITAGTSVLEPLRKTAGFPEMQVWECPMTDQAIPNGPKKARWIQTGTRPNHNPFFGTAMQDCGKEIKP
jgi:Cu(I)/Ag(I) efflux system membrane fusion protein